MVGWHHQLNGHEFEQTWGDSEGQGSLLCYSPWGHKELDTTEQRTTKTVLLHVESKPIKLLDTERRMVMAGVVEGKMRKCWYKGTSSGDLMSTW